MGGLLSRGDSVVRDSTSAWQVVGLRLDPWWCLPPLVNFPTLIYMYNIDGGRIWMLMGGITALCVGKH